MTYTIDSSNQFIDTNVLLYAYDETAGRKTIVAKKLIGELWQTNKGCLSVQVLQEFHNVATRKISRPLSLVDSRLIIDDFSIWRVHSPKVADILDAVRLQEDYQISFWDALVIQSANRLGCDIIWSEDLNHEQYYGNCRIVNPFQVY